MKLSIPFTVGFRLVDHPQRGKDTYCWRMSEDDEEKIGPTTLIGRKIRWTNLSNTTDIARARYLNNDQ